MKTKLPEGWKEITLSEVCEVKKGTSITKDKVTEGNIPVIAGGQQPAYYHNEANRSGETITVSGSGAYAGFVAYFRIPVFASDCSTIQAKNKEILTKYIYYLLKGQQKLIYNLQKGIAQPHVYPKDLAKIKIPLSPFPTQQKIVSILEKAEQAKEWRNKADELIKEFLKAVFMEMFGNKFPIKKLEELSSKISSGSTPLGGSENYLDNGEILFIRSQNVLMNKFSNHDKLYISKKIHENMKRTWVKKNDVLLNITGASIGRTAIYLGEDDKANVNQHVCIIRIKDFNKSNPLYINYYLSSEKIQGHIQSTNAGGTREALNYTQIKNFDVPVPPIELQNKFASIVQEIEAMKDQQKHSKEQVDKLFNALMQKAFRGELVV